MGINVPVQNADVVEIEILTPIVISTGEYETYKGQYEVVPDVEEDIVLLTKDKLMTRNVTVFKIPYFETHNESGLTVFIGEEITIN